MGKQYNKIEKRARHKKYKERQKVKNKKAIKTKSKK